MKKNEGFTLAELLIVVAIIGVLVAISIPIFTGQLKKSRAAVDQANVRSGKAAAVAQYLTEGVGGEKTYYYDSARGTVVTEATGIKGYGKSDEDLTGKLDDYATGVPKDGYVAITIKEDGTIEASWNGSASGAGGDSRVPDNNSLIRSDKFKLNEKTGNVDKYTSYSSIAKWNGFNNLQVGQGIKEGEYLYVCINPDAKDNAKGTSSYSTMKDYFENQADASQYFFRIDDYTPIIVNAVDGRRYPENTVKMDNDHKYSIYVNGIWQPII